MRVTRLDIRNLRCVQEARLQPGPGLNLLLGPNGAGKTSVLEALHLMAYGRSFRGRVRDGLIRTGSEAVEVFVAWGDHDRTGRAGLRHTGQAWEGRLDGQTVAHLGELCAALMVISIEPGSHALVSGSGEFRRRFVDWGLFHVEPEFLALWRRYARALKQRNLLLRSQAPDTQLEAWDGEVAETGERLARRREDYLGQLQRQVEIVAEALVPGLGRPHLAYLPGWREDQRSLLDALLLARPRDRALGHTTVGPHRADWRLDFAALPGREPLSRGQAKLAALTCLLAQAQDCARRKGQWPVIVLDDLASELDHQHQQRVLETLLGTGAQLFVSGNQAPDAARGVDAVVFHVEQGVVRQN